MLRSGGCAGGRRDVPQARRGTFPRRLPRLRLPLTLIIGTILARWGKRMKRIVSACLMLLLGAGAGAGLDQASDWADRTDDFSGGYEGSKAICRALKTKTLPASDMPSPAAVRALKGCDSEALYYGIGMPADPVRARQCAYAERDAGDEIVIGGSIMLMTIYANGVGAKRDLDLATHLACGIDGAPAESDGRVRHLAELEATGWAGTDFHYCDDITSGLAMGYCESHSARIAGARRNAALAALTRDWSAPKKAAFARLQTAHAAFVEAHGGGEVDLAGSARAAMSIAAEERARDEFLDIVRRLADGTAPRATSAGYRAADARLNIAYRKAISGAAGEDSVGAVTQSGIRTAQRAWLHYRDAFLAFARIGYKDLPQDSLAAWLTERRTAMLEERE